MKSNNNRNAGQSGQQGQGQDDRGQGNNQSGSRPGSQSGTSDPADSPDDDSDSDKRGFSVTDPKKQPEVVADVGKPAHESDKSPKFDSVKDREAGRKLGDGDSKNGSHTANR